MMGAFQPRVHEYNQGHPYPRPALYTQYQVQQVFQSVLTQTLLEQQQLSLIHI